MNISYYYTKTPEIEKLLTRIEIARALLDNLPPLPHIEEKLQRFSLLKSSLFSARIEGNRMTFDKLQYETMTARTDNLEKKEVFNIVNALQFAKNYKGSITKQIILEVHKRVMAGLSLTNEFRKEPSAIFNAAGVAVYLAPPPNQVPKLLDSLLAFVNSKSKDQAPSQAAIAHFAFEKIHPFLDGNGRVGRVITMMHLDRLGYGFKHLVSLEEYFDNHKEDYYYGLSKEGRDITEFTTFFLEALAESAEHIIEILKNKREETIEDTLLPRRAEILAIIRDHTIMSFDQLQRRFLKVNSRTLHYDLQFLLKKNLIKKLGKTRGALYSAGESF